MILKTIFLMALGILTTITPLQAEPPFTDLFGLYNRFKADYKHLSPISGLLVLKSGILANVRFHGNYGPEIKSQENDQVIPPLCHRQITNPGNNLPPSSDRDCPQDYTTAIAQQLFPSPAAGQLSAPGQSSDFFRAVSVGELGDILSLYTKLKESKVKTVEAFSLFKKIFERLVIRINKKDSLKNLWKDTGKSVEDLVNAYASMFAGALQEADLYPANFVESALLASAWMRVKEGSNLSLLLKAFNDFQDQHPKQLKSEKITQNKSFLIQYEEWKQEALGENKTLKKKAFKDLMKDPEKLVFMSLAYDLYDNPYPIMLGTSTAIHTYENKDKTINQKSFSNCGEAALLNFFNIILADTYTRTFNAEHLKNAFPNVADSLLAFYNGTKLYNPSKKDFEEYKQDTFEAVTNPKGRHAWADVVSSLNQEGNLPIQYESVCNIKGLGIDNILPVIANLLRDKELTMLIQEMKNLEESGEKQEKRASIMSYLFAKVSRKDFQLSWQTNGQNRTLENFVVIRVLINGIPQFTWKFNDGHFELNAIKEATIVDWRKGNPQALSWLLKSSLHDSLKRSLLPFYLPTNLNDINKEALTPFAPEIWYSTSLNGGEQILKAVDRILQLTDTFTKMALNLMNTIPDDPAMNRRVICLIYKHGLQENLSTYPHLNDVYHRAEEDFKKNPEPYFVNEYSDLFLRAMIKKYPKILLFNNKGSNTILHLAIRNGKINIVQMLLDDDVGRKVLLDQGNIKNKYGDPPLHLAIRKGETDIVQTLLSNKEVLKILLDQRNIKNNNGSTPLHLAIVEGKTGILQMLLDDKEALKILLKQENIKNNDGSTPFHLAIKKGKTGILQMLLDDKEVLKILLKQENIKDNHGNAPLYLAINNEKTDIVQMLLDDDVARKVLLKEENIKDNHGNTLLHLAIRNGETDIVQILLNNKEAREILLDKKNIKDTNGNTPLHVAISNGKIGMVQILLNNKEAQEILLDQENIKNNDGSTPLMLAIKMKHNDLGKFLFTINEIKVNEHDNHGNTALHYAAFVGNYEGAQILLDESADKEIKNHKRKTPLDVAIDRKHEKVSNLLHQN